jgi:hypothetical protein
VSGVQLAQQGNVVNAQGVITGCSLERVAEIMGPGAKSGWRRLKIPSRPRYWRYTLAFNVRPEGLTPGATPWMIWKEEGAPEFEIEVLEPSDYGVRQSGFKTVQARTLMPFSKESLDSGYQRMISARILRQLAEIFPFFEDHLISAYPEFRDKSASLERSPYSFGTLEEIPENLRCTSAGGGEKEGRGVGARSGIEGLFVASGESFPELGSLGPTVAALEGVSWLAHRSGLAGPFA